MTHGKPPCSGQPTIPEVLRTRLPTVLSIFLHPAISALPGRGYFFSDHYALSTKGVVRHLTGVFSVLMGAAFGKRSEWPREKSSPGQGFSTAQKVAVPFHADEKGQLSTPLPACSQPSYTKCGERDTYQGAAVFYRLTGVRTGEEIDVLRADGSHARFLISGVTEVKKTAFPSTAVFGPKSGATIRLITCTGPFNPTSRHYVDSLIIWDVAG